MSDYSNEYPKAGSVLDRVKNLESSSVQEDGVKARPSSPVKVHSIINMFETKPEVPKSKKNYFLTHDTYMWTPEQKDEIVYDKVYDQVDEKVDAKVADKVADKVDAKVADKVADKVDVNVDNKVDEKIADKVEEVSCKADQTSCEEVDQTLCMEQVLCMEEISCEEAGQNSCEEEEHEYDVKLAIYKEDLIPYKFDPSLKPLFSILVQSPGPRSPHKVTFNPVVTIHPVYTIDSDEEDCISEAAELGNSTPAEEQMNETAPSQSSVSAEESLPSKDSELSNLAEEEIESVKSESVESELVESELVESAEEGIERVELVDEIEEEIVEEIVEEIERVENIEEIENIESENIESENIKEIEESESAEKVESAESENIAENIESVESENIEICETDNSEHSALINYDDQVYSNDDSVYLESTTAHSDCVNNNVDCNNNVEYNNNMIEYTNNMIEYNRNMIEYNNKDCNMIEYNNKDCKVIEYNNKDCNNMTDCKTTITVTTMIVECITTINTAIEETVKLPAPQLAVSTNEQTKPSNVYIHDTPDCNAHMLYIRYMESIAASKGEVTPSAKPADKSIISKKIYSMDASKDIPLSLHDPVIDQIADPVADPIVDNNNTDNNIADNNNTDTIATPNRPMRWWESVINYVMCGNYMTQ